jgi:hypothetical protein
VSDALHGFCKRQVMQAVAEYHTSQQHVLGQRKAS